jgi:transcriptional regulator with XRE-family HTH domain
MKQETLANQIGVDRSYISQIERNADVNVGVKTIFALAQALGVSPAYLLGLTDNPLQGLDEEEEPAGGGRSLREAPAVYDIHHERRRRLLALLDDLDDDQQETLLAIAEAYRRSLTPRIVGHEEED